MSPRMRVWLKRGEEFYLFTLVTTAVFMVVFNFDINHPLKWAAFSLQFLGAILSVYVVYLSYNRHSNTSFLKEAAHYFKDFPAFRKKTVRVNPAQTLCTIRQHVVDTKKIEITGIDEGDWLTINTQLETIANAINSDRIYLKLLDERTSEAGEKIAKDILPRLGAHDREKKEEHVVSSRLMFVAFLWVIIGMLVESIPLASSSI